MATSDFVTGSANTLHKESYLELTGVYCSTLIPVLLGVVFVLLKEPSCVAQKWRRKEKHLLISLQRGSWLPHQ